MSRSRIRGPVLEIQNPVQLARVGRTGRPISLVGWKPAARLRFEGRLTEWSTACGCDTGASTMLAATLIAIAVISFDLVAHGLAAASAWYVVAITLAVFGGAFIGKLAGLAWAEIQWRRAVRAAISEYRPALAG